MAARPSGLKFNALGCIVLPAALFAGLMLSTAGMAIYPPITFVANPVICSGTIDYVSTSYSYRPGQQGVERTIYCLADGPKGARQEVTMKAIGVSFLAYSALFFLIFGFVLRPMLRRRYDRAMEAVRANQAMASLGSGAAPGGVQEIVARVAEAIAKGEAKVVVRDDPAAADDRGTNLGERLTELKELRDQGLITTEDYEAKKAELLSRL